MRSIACVLTLCICSVSQAQDNGARDRMEAYRNRVGDTNSAAISRENARYHAMIEQEKKEAEADQVLLEAGSQPRDWANSKGEVIANGVFVDTRILERNSMKFEHVRILLENDKPLDININDLTKEGRIYVKEQVALRDRIKRRERVKQMRESELKRQQVRASKQVKRRR